MQDNTLTGRGLKWIKKSKKSTLVTILLGVAAGVVLLLDLLTGSTPADQDSLVHLGTSVTLKLGGVILLIYITAYLLRKFGMGTFQKPSKEMEIYETLALSPRRSLHLVQVGDHRYLLGATDQSITLISEVDPEDNPVLETSAAIINPPHGTSNHVPDNGETQIPFLETLPQTQNPSATGMR